VFLGAPRNGKGALWRPATTTCLPLRETSDSGNQAFGDGVIIMCVAVCCSVLQCVCCSVAQGVAGVIMHA